MSTENYYLIQIDWPAGNPTLEEVNDLLSFHRVEVDQQYGLHLMDAWLERYVVRGKATPEAVIETEALGLIKFNRDPTIIENTHDK